MAVVPETSDPEALANGDAGDFEFRLDDSITMLPADELSSDDKLVPQQGGETRVGEMGLWILLEGLLLIANALAILNEDRFLAPRGWSFAEFSVGKKKTLKGQIIGLIYAVQYMRVPLILLNSISIVVKLVSG